MGLETLLEFYLLTSPKKNKPNKEQVVTSSLGMFYAEMQEAKQLLLENAEQQKKNTRQKKKTLKKTPHKNKKIHQATCGKKTKHCNRPDPPSFGIFRSCFLCCCLFLFFGCIYLKFVFPSKYTSQKMAFVFVLIYFLCCSISLLSFWITFVLNRTRDIL